MGSKLGPSYACLFVGYQEHLITQQYEGPFPHLIKRYSTLMTLLVLHLSHYINCNRSWTLFAIFILLSNSHLKSQRLNYHSWTSSYPSQVIPFLHPYITRLLMLTAFSTSHHHTQSKLRPPFLLSISTSAEALVR